MRKFPKLTQGDMLKVTWWDIVSDSVGDMDDAEPALCETLGFFWKYKGRGKSRSLVTGLTVFPKEEGEPRGWDVYPVGCLEMIEILTTSDGPPIVAYRRTLGPPLPPTDPERAPIPRLGV